ncbi:hypothetical protein ACIRL2_45010 [Embleya sp. NPDC127516]|uniref:hypothetical protein n=1 Tax=Embleya sp. NPDC127516 TaxID=3363990 RepID=UPI0037F1D97D
MSRSIARHLGTMDAIRAADVVEMARVESIGDGKAPVTPNSSTWRRCWTNSSPPA